MPVAAPSAFAGERCYLTPDYDLAATLNSGQAFRWTAVDGGWEGVVRSRWVRLESDGARLRACLAEPVADWGWLEEYLQLSVCLTDVLAAFPPDEPLERAVRHSRGLRLLRQEPWECLASFILSSTKQIIQIRQIVGRLCERFGEPVKVPDEHPPAHAFPSAARLAGLGEGELRGCGMGFRAPYLLKTARMVAAGEPALEGLEKLDLESARAALMRFPGVGRKIADCVLLFALGQPAAFPVDVWVLKALRQLYFADRNPSMKELLGFSGTHFGPQAGYAQQYLFHYMRHAGR